MYETYFNLPGVYLSRSYFYYFLIKKNCIEIQTFLQYLVLAETDAATRRVLLKKTSTQMFSGTTANAML